MEQAKRSNRKTRTGIVVSDKMQKTISVKIDRTMIHPLYGRVVRTSSKVMAHDPEEKAGIGDEVLMMETRPTSKNKRWRLVDVLKRAK